MDIELLLNFPKIKRILKDLNELKTIMNRYLIEENNITFELNENKT